MSYLLDPNFYASIPLYVYVSGGFGIIIAINSCVLCCYCCRINKLRNELDMRERDINRRENYVKHRERLHDDDTDIHLSMPMKYQSDI